MKCMKIGCPFLVHDEPCHITFIDNESTVLLWLCSIHLSEAAHKAAQLQKGQVWAEMVGTTWNRYNAAVAVKKYLETVGILVKPSQSSPWGRNGDNGDGDGSKAVSSNINGLVVPWGRKQKK